MAVTAYQALARVADTQVRQVRRNARMAWTAVAVMTVGVIVAVGWTTHRLTRASTEIGELKDRVTRETQTAEALAARQDSLRIEHSRAEQTLRAELAARAETATAERTAAELTLRNEVNAARESAARAAGMLEAYRQQEQARQTAGATTAPIGDSAASDKSAEDISSAITAGARQTSDKIRDNEVSDEMRRLKTPAATTKPGAESVASKGTADSDDRRIAPVTRPSTSRRKVRSPATQPAAGGDTPSASSSENPATN